MAIDQALLEMVTEPVLRTYCWAGPAASFGYAQSAQSVRESVPYLPLVRRWTGGGVVPHEGDWTFALVCPMGVPFAQVAPEETYRRIHAAVVESLAQEGIPARLVASEETRSGMSCFVAPALHDVFDAAGRKICGGAQRRTKQGFLHQGSIQDISLPASFAQTLASRLAEEVFLFVAPADLEGQASGLVRERYGTVEWLEKMP